MAKRCCRIYDFLIIDATAPCRKEKALKKPLRGVAENVVQLADLQCAFRAQAGNSPL